MAKKAVKPIVKKRVINNALALETVTESLAQVCECGHLSSEHMLKKHKDTFVEVECGECECPKFKQAYKLEVISNSKPDKKSRHAK